MEQLLVPITALLSGIAILFLLKEGIRILNYLAKKIKNKKIDKLIIELRNDLIKEQSTLEAYKNANIDANNSLRVASQTKVDNLKKAILEAESKKIK